MRKIQSIAFLLIILLSSCHLEDFNLDKLSVTSKPTIYGPLAYGTFKVKDYLPYVGADDQVVFYPEIELTPQSWNRGEASFNSDAMDSTYLVVTYTNGTPMKMQVQFSFTNYSTGAVSGSTYDSGIILPGTADASGKVTQPTITAKEYYLNSNDLQTIKATDGVKCIIKLIQTGNPVLVKNLKESEFKVQLNLKTNVLLGKL